SDIVEEFAQHLDDRYQELVSGGTPAEAAQAAVIEELRKGHLDAQLRPLIARAPSSPVPGERQRGMPLAGLWKDLHYAFRTLRLSPGFATVAILSLMLGIGANTAIFQLLNAVQLRSLPVQSPEQLADARIAQSGNGRIGAFRGRIPQLTNDIWE